MLEWLGQPPPTGSAELRIGAEPALARVPDGHVVAMDPVSLAADLRELHLLDPAPVLSVGEADELAASIEPALSAREMALLVADATRWYAVASRPFRFAAPAPAVAAARGVRDNMPRGDDGRAMRALMNEIQMIWHEHPVNRQRAERGLPPVNSVWFWGAGSGGGEIRPSLAPPPLVSDDPLLRGLWRHLGGEIPAGRDETGLRELLRRGGVASVAAADLGRLGIERLARWHRLSLALADGAVVDLAPWRRFRPRRESD